MWIFCTREGIEIKKYKVLFISSIVTVMYFYFLIIPTLNKYRDMKYYRVFHTLLLPVKIEILFIIMSFALGVMAGLSYYLNERKKVGVWKVRIKRVFILLVCLYFAMPVYAYYSDVEILLTLYDYFEVFLIAGADRSGYTNTLYFFLGLGYFFQILCGYTLIKCFYKKAM